MGVVALERKVNNTVRSRINSKFIVTIYQEGFATAEDFLQMLVRKIIRAWSDHQKTGEYKNIRLKCLKGMNYAVRRVNIRRKRVKYASARKIFKILKRTWFILLVATRKRYSQYATSSTTPKTPRPNYLSSRPEFKFYQLSHFVLFSQLLQSQKWYSCTGTSFWTK